MNARGLQLLLTLGVALAAAQENYGTWTYHKYVAVNTRANGGGAGVVTDVRDFPVLVRLDSSNFSAGFAQSVGRGADLRFTRNGDAVRLPHQIERWDSAGKKAEIWVKLDTVKGGALNTFRMHWGKAGAADSSKSAAVFDTAAGFQAVWHLNETAGDSARDATVNRFNGVPAGAPGTAAGPIGPARTFNGTNQWFEVPGSASGKLNFPIDGFFTFSAWAYIDPVSPGTPQDNSVIVMKHDNQYALKLDLYGNWQFYEYDGTWSAVLSPYEENRWTYVVGVMNGRDTYLYVDGVEAISNPDCCNGGGNRNEGTNVFIGRRGDMNQRWWRGNLDEVRIASGARSADWVKLEYENQKPSPTMIFLSDSTPVVAVNGERAARPALGSIRPVTGGLLFNVATGEHPRAEFSVVDLRGHKLWSRAVPAAAGSAQATWNPGALQSAASIYAVKMSVLDARGGVVKSETRKIALTR